MCLQVEVCDDNGGSCAPDITSECHGFVNDNDASDVQQVNYNFRSIITLYLSVFVASGFF